MSQCSKSETDVLIVGAGPTGLTIACELRRCQINCRLIEQSDRFSQTSKALGIHSRTLEVFEDMGIIDQVLAQGIRLTGVNVYENQQRLLHFSLNNLKAPYPFVLMLPQSETEQLLAARFRQLGGEVEWSKELTGLQQQNDRAIAFVTATSESTVVEEEIQARWLIGGDGAHSLVRRSLSTEFEGSTYEETFLLADVELDWNRPHNESQAWLHRDGLFAALPLPKSHSFPGDDRRGLRVTAFRGQQWRLFADITARDEDIPQPSVELFQQLMQERTGDTTTTIYNPTWLSNFKIHRRIVDNYRHKRVFLAGDAAHIHSPFGGQGMNTGIQDAYNLAWKLALVLHNKASTTLLDTYEEERRPIAKEVLSDTHASTSLLIAKNPVLRLVRDRLILRLASLNFVQRLLLRKASELDVNYRQSSLSQTYRGFWSTQNQSESPSLKARLDFETAPKAGDRAPQGFCLRYSSQSKTSLFEEFKGTHFCLLLFAGLTQTAGNGTHLMSVAEWVDSILDGQIRSYLVVLGDKPAFLNWKGTILLDPDNELHNLYGARAESLYLIRPDGYIGFRSQPVQKEPLVQYLSQIFRL